MARTQPLVVKGRFVNPGFASTAARGPMPEEGAAGEAAQAERAGFGRFLKWQRERRRARKLEDKTVDVPRVERAPETIAPAPARGIALTWMGHSTVLLQLDGKNYLTDPVWSKRIGGVVARKTPPGMPMSALPRIDAVLQSHNHYDHLDAGTWAQLPKDTPVYCTTGVAAWFRKRKFSDITERSWWESSPPRDGHTITCVPAQHFSGRTLWDRDKTLWGAWVVQGPHSSAYFAGDSGYCSAFKEVGEAFPGLDVTLMPIGAYEPRWFMAPVHVDPPEAGQAFLDCGARAMLPIHWGTFRLADETIDEPPRALKRWWEKQGLAPERLLSPRMGETIRV